MDSKRTTINTLFGEGSKEFAINNSILMQIQIKTTTASTTFDAFIEDVNGMIVWSESNNQGELNELISLPVYGNQTINILNASIDEAITVILTYRRS